MHCTASPLYIEGLRKSGKIPSRSQDSIYSLEGTEAHDWAGKVLDEKKPLPITDVPENFRPHIQEYQQVCLECEHKAGDTSIRIVESKVPLFYSPNDNGTVDYAFLRMDDDGKPEGLFIRDLKYGMGVPVDAEENTQLAIYAQSLIADLTTWYGKLPDHLQVSIGIHQPRYHGDDTLKLWEITVGELREFTKAIGKTAKRIAKASHTDELEFVPSDDTCRFCDAKYICKARQEAAFQDVPAEVMNLEMFDDMSAPDLETVSPETMLAIYKNAKSIKKWIEDITTHMTSLAAVGTPVEGTKLVKGRDGNRAWKDKEEARKFLVPYLKGGAFKPEEIISPSQAETALKQIIEKKPLETHMVKLTERSEGKPVLALEEDKRLAIAGSLEDFDVIDDTE